MFSNRALSIKNQKLLRDMAGGLGACTRELAWEHAVERCAKEPMGHWGFTLGGRELAGSYTEEFRLQEMSAWGRPC